LATAGEIRGKFTSTSRPLLWPAAGKLHVSPPRAESQTFDELQTQEPGTAEQPTTGAFCKSVPARKQSWKISFELAFGEYSPYSRKYPSLYDLPYNVNRAITRDVLQRIIAIALRETGARQLQVIYAPGGYLQYPVVPSAQLDVEASPTATSNMLDIIGYLAQQTEVMACRPFPGGDKPALQIVEQNGSRLARPETVERFWQHLRRRAPYVQGFLPVRVNGRPGIRIIDTASQWSVREVVGFDSALESVTRELHVATSTRRFMVQSSHSCNDWKTYPDGKQYLDRLKNRGQSQLVIRLLTKYRPQVGRWIEYSFKEYAPGRLKRNLNRATTAKLPHCLNLCGLART
jgi:hypothetical protein